MYVQKRKAIFVHWTRDICYVWDEHHELSKLETQTRADANATIQIATNSTYPTETTRWFGIIKCPETNYNRFDSSEMERLTRNV